MSKFQHFLITRINLGYKERINENNITETDWLNYRFDLFFKTSFLSVVNQKNQNFKWLIYIDSRTPQFYKTQLREKVCNFKNIVILEKSGGFDSIKIYAGLDVKSHNKILNKYIITTRIDSDDLIDCNFIGEIQNLFNYQEYMSINYTNGWIYDLNLGLIGKFKSSSNAFISLIERIDNKSKIQTVWYQSHTDYILENNRIEIKSSKRLWCVNIHNLNDSTKFKGLPVFFIPKNINLNFGFNFQINSSFIKKLEFSFFYFSRQSKKIFKLLRLKFLK